MRLITASLTLFSRKNEDKKVTQVEFEPTHSHSKAVVLPTGLLEFPTAPSSFKHLNVSFFELSAWYSCVYIIQVYTHIESNVMKPVSNPTLTLTSWSLRSTFLQCKAPKRSRFTLFRREANLGTTMVGVNNDCRNNSSG